MRTAGFRLLPWVVILTALAHAAEIEDLRQEIAQLRRELAGQNEAVHSPVGRAEAAAEDSDA